MLKCRTILQNQGQLESLLCTQQKSHMIKFVSLIIISYSDTYSTMDPSVPLSASKIIVANPIALGFATASREANKALIAIDEVHNSLLLFFFGAAIA